MPRNQRNITANNATAREEILKAAMYSYSGRIIYDKWNKKTKKFDKRSHVIVPIDCGVTARNNPVLYAEDIEDGMQLKQFIIKQIRDFKNHYEKHSTMYPIQVDRIKQFLGVDDFKFRMMKQEDSGMAAGVHHERNLVAKELCRIAQEIYEFSGCEGHLYSDKKKKNPYSYEVVGDDGRDKASRIARNIVALLSPSQRELTEHFTKQRKEGLSFGDYFKWDSNGRCFIPLQSGDVVQDVSKIDDPNTKEIMEILKKEGYVCPDYATGYCYKDTDKDYSAKNAPKVLTILKKALKNDKEAFSRLSKAFNERESGTMKRKGLVKLMMCVTHSPEDVAGMSTDRNWVSCMRLPSDTKEVTERELRNIADNKAHEKWFIEYYGLFGHEVMTVDEIAEENNVKDVGMVVRAINRIKDKLASGGEYYTTALKQVKEGGMVAYLVREDDRNVDDPLARLAIKRLSNSDGGFKFIQENRVYGDEYVAKSCDFAGVLRRELEKSNKTTEKGDGVYGRSDTGWTDAHIYKDYGEITVQKLCKLDWEYVYEILRYRKPRLTEKDVSEIINSHNRIPPKGIFDLFDKCCGGLSEEFEDEFGEYMDIDKINLRDGIDLIPSAPYEGDDAPRDEEQMIAVLKNMMGEAMPSYGYGEINEDYDAEFEGNVSPTDVYHRGDVPSDVLNYAINEVNGELKRYYDATSEFDDDFKDTYKNFALFEEAYNNGELDREMMWEINDGMADDLQDSSIPYAILVRVKDIYDGYEQYDSVYVLDGTFTYYLSSNYGGESKIVAYENEFVINTEDAGWKKKLKECIQDLFDQIPNFYY